MKDGLKNLVALILLIMPSPSGLGSASTLDDAENDRKTLALIAKLGGRVTVGNNSPDQADVTVELTASSISDSDLKEVLTLHRVSSLHLSYTAISDVGLNLIKDVK